MAIPKWLHNKTIAVFDLECDLIPTTKIYMNGVSIITIDNEGTATSTPSKVFCAHWTPYSNGSLYESIALINECDYTCGHNIQAFDRPELMRHMSTDITAISLDTLLLAKIMFSKDELFSIDASLAIPPKLYGSYSLEAFGHRLGSHKISFNNFDVMTAEMATYCNQDVDLTVELILFLLNKPNFPLEAVVSIEHKAAAIIAEQERLGFHIDIDKTRALNTKLLTEKVALAAQLSEIFKPKWLKDGQLKTYKKPSKVRKYLPNNHYKPLIGTFNGL